MVMDGVYPPRLKDLSAGKENRPADPELAALYAQEKVKHLNPGLPQSLKKFFPSLRNPQKPSQLRYISPDLMRAMTLKSIEDKHLQSITNQIRPQNELPK